MTVNPNLKRPDLKSSDGGAGDAGCKRLAEALWHDKNVKIVELSANNLGGDSCDALVTMLHHREVRESRSLTSVTIARNELGDRGVARFGSYLESRRAALKSLSLAKTGCRGDGAAALGRGLAEIGRAS